MLFLESPHLYYVAANVSGCNCSYAPPVAVKVFKIDEEIITYLRTESHAKWTKYL